MSETTSRSQSGAPDLIGIYYRTLWRRAHKLEFELEEESPTALETINSSGGFSLVGPDRLSVSYPNISLHKHDVGAVQANRPAPSKRLLYYFEMYTKNAGAMGQFSIGFTTSGFKLRRHPGWEANSIGYHGDDGLLYRGLCKGEPFGPIYHTAETVGAGINYATQEFFFTLNGNLVGSVHKHVKGPVFPTVAVHSDLEQVLVNFGEDDFVFDIKAYEAEQRAKQQMAIDDISISQDISYGLVRSYLQHYGYEETLDSLDNEIAAGTSNKEEILPISYALYQRRTLRQLIMRGDIDVAFSKLQEWYPQILQDEYSHVRFLLHCQKFIEFVRVGKLEEAMLYGRKEFLMPKSLSECDTFFWFIQDFELVKDCASLLALEEPGAAGYLLLESQKELLADAMNAEILSTNPNVVNDKEVCIFTCLEKLIRQLTACSEGIQWLNGNQGEAFHLYTFLNTTAAGKKD